MRTNRQKIEHQGKLSPQDNKLATWMRRRKKHYTTTLEICLITGCVSARDRIRKLRANGIQIGPAKFLYRSKRGASVFGWKIV